MNWLPIGDTRFETKCRRGRVSGRDGDYVQCHIADGNRWEPVRTATGRQIYRRTFRAAKRAVEACLAEQQAA